MEKLFDLTVQKHHAELIIAALLQNKSPEAQELAQDLNDKFVWNYRQSLIKV